MENLIELYWSTEFLYICPSMKGSFGRMRLWEKMDLPEVEEKTKLLPQTIRTIEELGIENGPFV
jgi:hypothetical protein